MQTVEWIHIYIFEYTVYIQIILIFRHFSHRNSLKISNEETEFRLPLQIQHITPAAPLNFVDDFMNATW